MAGIKDKVVITFSVLFCSITAEAGPVSLPPVGLPPVNLGDTSFQDGIANPGWLLEETINYYEASQFKDAQGGTIPGSNELTTISAVTHLAYISKLRLLGGYFGAEDHPQNLKGLLMLGSVNAVNSTIVSFVSFIRGLAGFAHSSVVSLPKTSALPRAYRWTRNFLPLLPTFSVPRFP